MSACRLALELHDSSMVTIDARVCVAYDQGILDLYRYSSYSAILHVLPQRGSALCVHCERRSSPDYHRPMSSIPPPPPEGHEGVYPAQTPSTGQQLWSFAKSAASGIATKAREVDERLELSKKAAEKTAEVSKSVKESAGSAFTSISEVASKQGAAVGRRVGVMTPEERQQWLDGATTVANCAMVFGGPRARALAGVTNLGVRAAGFAGVTGVANPDRPSQSSQASASTASTVTELVEVQVVATVAGGGTMRVHVEGAGEFEVTVPPGVSVGQSFTVELEAPLNVTEPEVVPVGLPADVSDVTGAAQPVPMAQAVPVSTGQPVGAASAVPPASGGGVFASLASSVTAVTSAGTMARELHQAGVTPQQVGGIANGLHQAGVTPQQALSGVRVAGQAAKELGVTPQQALSVGMNAMKILGSASSTQAPSGPSGPGPRR